MLRGKKLFGCMVVLVVVALILSGCGKSSGEAVEMVEWR